MPSFRLHFAPVPIRRNYAMQFDLLIPLLLDCLIPCNSNPLPPAIRRPHALDALTYSTRRERVTRDNTPTPPLFHVIDTRLARVTSFTSMPPLQPPSHIH